MEKYTLTNSDDELLKKLFDITKKISDKYDTLSNKKFDLKELTKLLKEENDIYLSINNEEQIERLLLKLKVNLNNFFDELKIIVNSNKNELIRYRIIYRLLDKKEENTKNKLMQMDREVREELKSLEITLKKDDNFAYIGLVNLIILNRNIKFDYLNSVLNLSKDNFKQKYLKYILAFLYKPIEIDLINSKFINNKNLYWTSKIIVDIRKIPLETFENCKKEFGYNMALKIIDYLENDYNNLIWQLLLKVSMLFCTYEERNNIKSKYLECNLEDDVIPNIVSFKV